MSDQPGLFDRPMVSRESLREGRRLRDRALRGMEGRERNKEFLEFARDVAEDMFLTMTKLPADKHRLETERRARAVGQWLPLEGRLWGAVFNNKRRFVKVGQSQTSIAHCHGRPVAVWSLRRF